MLLLLMFVSVGTTIHATTTIEVAEGDEFATKSMFEAIQQVGRAIHRSDIKWQQKEIWEDPHKLLQFFKRPPDEESAQLARAGDVFDVTISLVNKKLKEKHHRSKRRVNETDSLSSSVVQNLMTFSGCRANLRPPSCPDTCLANMYRTHSGACNNRANPHWGATNLPFARWRPSVYENSFNSPLGWNRGRRYNGFPLPDVRVVSNDVMSTMNSQVTSDPSYSHLLVVWGQYIDHDIDFTPQSLSTSTFQGLTDCRTTCANEFPCFPMQVPRNDPRISSRRCIPFFRSAAVCGTGHTSSLTNNIQPREQINAINAFVDASAVYGNSEAQSMDLRDFSNQDGLMKVNPQFRDSGNREYLPFNPANPCVQDRFDTSGVSIPCFKAGDGRASEHLTLAVIHTLWMREHNRLARALKRVNAHWSGETLYQEARKIVSAFHQIVNWKEYLPKILGPTGMRMMGNYTGYNSSVNPTVSNVFATAAFRFGHVTIAPEFRRLDENFTNHRQFPSIMLHDAFFSPWRLIRQGGGDPVIRGLIGRPAKLITANQMMHEELRERLFALQNQVALDLASLNLQRGRDHALPHYNEWRRECGLPPVRNFTELASEISNPELRRKLEQAYGHPGNIDIWLAGLAEDLQAGARVGPTFNCLLSRQFRLLRDGDRFFYRNPGVFTSQQLASLERFSFARIICDNSGVNRVQRDVFSLATFPRDFVACSDIPQLDLSLWRESPAVGGCGRPADVTNGGWKKCGSGVSYYCNRGFTLTGADVITCVNNRFSAAAPTCVDVNECGTNMGGCMDRCENTMGSFTCGCNEGRMMMSDGRRCVNMTMTSQPQDEAATNVEAAVIGSVFGVIIIAGVMSSAVLIYKYQKLRKMKRFSSTRKFSFTDDKPTTFDNPSAATGPNQM